MYTNVDSVEAFILSLQLEYKIENSCNFFTVRPDPPVIQGGSLQKVTLGEHKNLSCTSANGKPGAEITWYKDSVRIVDKVFSVTDRNGVKDKRETTISHVTIIPTEEDHGKRIECRASNAVQIQPLKALATLDVQCMYELSPLKTKINIKQSPKKLH